MVIAMEDQKRLYSRKLILYYPVQQGKIVKGCIRPISRGRCRKHGM